ncbi:MAG TPA: aldose 1-epimerase [Stellaceae bacterium]|jgi:aldose 1-epimerase|nr:aldose 1-epimerase [Stellaceae bacterium]
MSEPGNEIVTLASGAARLAVAPFLGGSLLGYWWEIDGVRHDWLVASREAGVAGFPELLLASFPLVPYSNRIRDGRFTFRGRAVDEPIAPGHPNALHGHGWRLPWQVIARGEDGLTMEYEHRPMPGGAGWPWLYRAWQHLALTPQALIMTMGIENRAGEAMPAGLGHHPYFPRTAHSRVNAEIAGIWWPEAGQLPVERVTPPPDADPRRGVAVDKTSLDHGYAGWQGSARIDWPERRAELTMAADPALSTLVIYSPPERGFVCVEPVSHCIDAFNLAAKGMSDTGMHVLAPGASWEATVRFTPVLG